MKPSLATAVRSFFEDHLRVQKGLRPASVRSYRDAIRLYLAFAAAEAVRPMSGLAYGDLTFERAKRFLRHLEDGRSNHPRTRNHRLAAIRTFHEYLGARLPEMIEVAQQVKAIPFKRAAPRPTHFLEVEEVRDLINGLPVRDRRALRDRTLLLFLWNTGARVQEVADLRWTQLDLGPRSRVELHGKGDKWRACPLWPETARELAALRERSAALSAESPVFTSARGQPLTRFGIYKTVRRLASALDRPGPEQRRVSPHLFRHTAAVHLLESGVELNVIRGWLGHVSLESTNRYAEITTRTKEKALRACRPSLVLGGARARKAAWKADDDLLAWLEAL